MVRPLVNACSKFVVGAERAGWESLLKLKSVDSRSTKNSQGVIALVVDPAKVSA